MGAREKEVGERVVIKVLFSSVPVLSRVPVPPQQSSKFAQVLQRASLRREDRILRSQSPGHTPSLHFEECLRKLKFPKQDPIPHPQQRGE